MNFLLKEYSIIKKQKGVALITVMLITAITAIVSGEIITNQNRAANRTVQLINSDQGILNVWSAENFVKIILIEDLKESPVDHSGEDWTTPVTFPVDGGTISGELVDETAKFNINNIIDDKGKLRTIKINKQNYVVANRILNLFNKLNIQSPEELISAIIDWMDSDTSIYNEIKPYRGAEDEYYITLDPPYRTANRKLLDISELRLVKGMTPEIYRQIQPFLTALPEYTSINANFAQSEVISMLDENISPEAINKIIKSQNKKNAFQSYNDIISEIQNYALDSSASTQIAQRLTQDVINIKTEYFRLKTSVYLDQSVTHATTIFRRKDNRVSIVWRGFGLWDE